MLLSFGTGDKSPIVGTGPTNNQIGDSEASSRRTPPSSPMEDSEGKLITNSPDNRVRVSEEVIKPPPLSPPTQNPNHMSDEHKVTDHRLGPWATVALIALPLLLGAAAGALVAVALGAPIGAIFGMIAIGAIIGLTASSIVLWTLEAMYREASFQANQSPIEEPAENIKKIINEELKPKLDELGAIVPKVKTGSEQDGFDFDSDFDSNSSLNNLDTSLKSPTHSPSPSPTQQVPDSHIESSPATRNNSGFISRILGKG